MEYTELLDFTAYLDVSRIHSPNKSDSEIIRDYIKKSNNSERSDEARTLELNEEQKEFALIADLTIFIIALNTIT